MTTLTLSLSPSNPAPGATVTATYAFSGAPADHTITVAGTATEDGVTYNDSETITLTHQQSFQAPTAPGMTFVGTADAHVWTAVAPAS